MLKNGAKLNIFSVYKNQSLDVNEKWVVENPNL